MADEHRRCPQCGDLVRVPEGKSIENCTWSEEEQLHIHTVK